MSTLFVRITDINEKLNTSITDPDEHYVTKSFILETFGLSLQTSYLEKYNDNDFVIEDDIVPSLTMPPRPLQINLESNSYGYVGFSESPTELSASVRNMSGTSITIYASSISGYHFVQWIDSSGNYISDKATYTFTISKSVTYTAIFEKDVEIIPSYQVNFTIDSGIKTITINGNTYNRSGSILVQKGNNVSWSCTFNTGYTANTQCSGTKIVDGVITINATSKLKEYTITLKLGDHCLSGGYQTINNINSNYTDSGQISKTGTTLTLGHFTSITYTITAESNYAFSDGNDMLQGTFTESVTSSGEYTTPSATRVSRPDKPALPEYNIDGKTYRQKYIASINSNLISGNWDNYTFAENEPIKVSVESEHGKISIECSKDYPDGTGTTNTFGELYLSSETETKFTIRMSYVAGGMASGIRLTNNINDVVYNLNTDGDYNYHELVGTYDLTGIEEGTNIIFTLR